MLVFLLTALAFAKTSAISFTTDIRWGEGHGVTWSFAQEQAAWKTPASQIVQSTCDQPHTFIANWTNSRTLKVTISPELIPGEKCQFTLSEDLKLEKKSYEAYAPMVKVTRVGPWRFNEGLHEDDPIMVQVDHRIDPIRLASKSYLEVQGLEEKVELSAPSPEVAAELSKREWTPEGSHSYWLVPRRRLPTGKKIALHITQDQTLAFQQDGKVRDEFLATVNCDRGTPDGPCSPLGSISVNLSASAPLEQLQKIRLVIGKTEHSPEVKNVDNDGASYVSFKVTLEAEAQALVKIPADFKDTDGRILANAKKFPVTMQIGEFPPLAKISGTFGILEDNKDVMLPVTIRNTDRPIKIHFNQARWGSMGAANLLKWLTAVQKRQDRGWEKDLRSTSVFTGTNLPLTRKELTPTLSKKEMEIIGLPLPGKGLHIVEVESPKLGQSLLGDNQKFYISSLVLVTNLAIHLKVGSESALVWVTSLDKGEPVAGAKLTVANCLGATLATATTGKDGVALIPKLTEAQRKCHNKEADSYNDVMVLAQTANDFSFTRSSWDNGIESWRYSVTRSYYEDRLNFHTIFDRPLYQQGQTVSGLVIARDFNDKGLIFPTKALAKQIEIKHQETDKTWISPVSWNELKAGSFAFKIPSEAPMGNYQLSFVQKNAKGQVTDRKSVGSFNVEAYKVPLMSLRMKWQDNQDKFTSEKPSTISGNLHYLSGPPAADQKLTVRGVLRPSYGMTFKAFEGFRFATGDAGMLDASEPTETLAKVDAKTNKAGSFTYRPANLKKLPYVSYLSMEVEYMDPNGMLQSQTIAGTLVPSLNVVGIKVAEGETDTKKAKTVSFAVTDLNGRPMKNSVVSAVLYSRKYFSVRKKILGGFYSYESGYKNTSLGKFCDGKTNAQGILTCSHKFKEGGEHIIEAKAKDSNGDESSAYVSHHVQGPDDYWQPVEAHDRADLVADKKEYTVGDTALLDFKIPFEESWVLLTRERKNVLTHQVLRLTRAQPAVKLQLKDTDSPNQFISAMAVRGRVAAAAPSGMIDLGKPAFRMGLTEIQVKRPETKLAVKVDLSAAEIKVRDMVKAKINVSRMIQAPLGKTKIAIAVIDAGLLELAPHLSTNLDNAFAIQFGHGVNTSTSTGLVVGRRHFGLKAKPTGGDGGSKPARELFDTLLYWNPNIAVDAKGNAEVSFKANDSLTEFKVFAVAYSETLFGTGIASFKITQDLMTFASLSPTLRVGDVTRSTFTLQNTTKTDMPLKASYEVSLAKEVKRQTQEVVLKPVDAQILNFENPALTQPGTLKHNLKLVEGNKTQDQIITSQPVLPLHTPIVEASDFYEVKNSLEIPAPGKKGNESHIQLFFSPSVLGSREALEQWMIEYPFQCLEQETARLVINRNKPHEAKYRNALPMHQDSDGLFRYYPNENLKGSPTLTAHIVEMLHWKGLKMDPVVMAKAEAGLMRVAKGEIGMEGSLEKYRARVRLHSLATLHLVKSISIQPQYALNYKHDPSQDTLNDLLDKWIIFSTTNRSEERDAVLQDIARRFEVSSAKMELKARTEDQDFWMLSTPVGHFAKFLLLTKQLGLSPELESNFKGQEAKWLRGFAALKNRGHYGETISNSFAALIHDKFATSSPTGKTVVNGQQSYSWPGDHQSLSVKGESMFAPLKIQHQGQGTPFVDVQYLGFLDAKKSYEQGFNISKTVEYLEGSSPKVGQRMKYVYQATSKQNSTLVAMRLPVPSGVTILQVEVEGLYPQFQERDFTEARIYFDEVPAGKTFKVTLTVRPNTAGTFGFPGARIEEMYAAQVFGKEPDQVVTIE